MKYIDISTSHNISIRYELAGTLLRALAWGIDTFFLFIYAILVSFVAFSNTFLFYFLFFFVFAFYHLAFEILNNGQSPGKQILKIKVVTIHGRTAKAQDYFLRWIFRMMEITSTLGIIASLFISSTEKNQRIGDMLARTTVVKLRNNQLYNLKELVRMGNQVRTITYPNVVMYNDTDMMLVKDAMQRVKANANKASKNFAVNLANKISEDLEVKIEHGRYLKFLETVLLDYITLTR